MTKEGPSQNKVGPLLFAVLGLAAVIASVSPQLADRLDIPYAASKPYKSFEAFFPFYMSQHQNEVCRRLHVIGTTLVVLLTALDVNIGVSFVLAALVGFSSCALLRSQETGLAEMALVGGSFLGCFKYLTGSVRKAILTLVIGYGFAWVGHFFFENNRPATFIYPSYSLAGDLRLFFEVITRQRAF